MRECCRRWRGRRFYIEREMGVIVGISSYEEMRYAGSRLPGDRIHKAKLVRFCPECGESFTDVSESRVIVKELGGDEWPSGVFCRECKYYGWDDKGILRICLASPVGVEIERVDYVRGVVGFRPVACDRAPGERDGKYYKSCYDVNTDGQCDKFERREGE